MLSNSTLISVRRRRSVRQRYSIHSFMSPGACHGSAPPNDKHFYRNHRTPSMLSILMCPNRRAFPHLIVTDKYIQKFPVPARHHLTESI